MPDLERPMKSKRDLISFAKKTSEGDSDKKKIGKQGERRRRRKAAMEIMNW